MLNWLLVCAIALLGAWPALAAELTAFLFATGGQQLRVEFFEITRLGHGCPVVTPEVSGLTLDAALGLSC